MNCIYGRRWSQTHQFWNAHWKWRHFFVSWMFWATAFACTSAVLYSKKWCLLSIQKTSQTPNRIRRAAAGDDIRPPYRPIGGRRLTAPLYIHQNEYKHNVYTTDGEGIKDVTAHQCHHSLSIGFHYWLRHSTCCIYQWLLSYSSREYSRIFVVSFVNECERI